jgi:hypothetical protein
VDLDSCKTRAALKDGVEKYLRYVDLTLAVPGNADDVLKFVIPRVVCAA